MGYGRGSVGDVILSRNGGVQTSRARNRQPRNPKSPLQCAQRSIQKCVAQAYSMLRPICNHSFEGQTTATENQARFTKLNVQMMREKAAACLGDPATLTAATVTSYPGADTVDLLYNDFIVSEGTLAPPSLNIKTYDGSYRSPSLTFDSEILEDGEIGSPVIWQAWGVPVNCQLTFVGLYTSFRGSGVSCNAVEGITYARLVPKMYDDGDYFVGLYPLPEASTPDFGDIKEGRYYANDPKESKNEGVVTVEVVTNTNGTAELHVVAINDIGVGNMFDNESKVHRHIVGLGVIVSEFTDGWRRSTSSLFATDAITPEGVVTLGAAVQSFMEADRLSGKYLNQAK